MHVGIMQEIETACMHTLDPLITVVVDIEIISGL